MKQKSNEIILFEDQDVRLEVNMKDETVWLSQEQMAKLFGKATSTINEHIKNIYKEGELDEPDTMTKFGNSEFRDYAIKGYAINQQRLEYLEKTVQLIDIAGRILFFKLLRYYVPK